MKKLFYIILSIGALSCATDDATPLEDNCAAARAEINAKYDAQITWVRDNTAPDDEAQITLINQERQAMILAACSE